MTPQETLTDVRTAVEHARTYLATLRRVLPQDTTIAMVWNEERQPVRLTVADLEALIDAATGTPVTDDGRQPLTRRIAQLDGANLVLVAAAERAAHILAEAVVKAGEVR